MTVTDAHLHLFPDEASGLLAQGGQQLAGYTGIEQEVRTLTERGRVGRVLAITTATTELIRRLEQGRWPAELKGNERRRREAMLEEHLLSRIREQNAWICEVASANPRLGAAVTADPTIDAVQMLADLGNRFLRPEAKAVKIHPALSYVYPDHPGYLGAYRLAEEAGIPIVSHGGSSAGTFYESVTDYCAPANFAAVLERFPRLTLVVAHLGQPFYDDLVALGRTYPNVCTDLSYVLGGRLLSADRLVSVIRDFGVERVLFGSDFPYFDPEDSLDYLGDAGLSAGELELVMDGNAERILAL